MKSDGEWFEQFTAYAFEKAGARDMSYRIRIERSEESVRAIAQRIGMDEDIFLRDMDVLGTFGSSHFLVSCKLGDSANVNPKDEVKQMSSLVGRFTLSFFCKFICNESKLELNYGKVPVRIIGWRDLCSPKKLQSYVKELRKLIA